MAVIEFHRGSNSTHLIPGRRVAQPVTFNEDVFLESVTAWIRSGTDVVGNRAAVWSNASLSNVVAEASAGIGWSTDFSERSGSFPGVPLTAGVTYYIGWAITSDEGNGADLRTSRALSFPHSHISGSTTATLQPRLGVTGSSSYSDPSDLVLDVHFTRRNQPPLAPTLNYPVGSVLDRRLGHRFTWGFNDPNLTDPSDAQSAYSLRYRPAGTSAWTSIGWITSPSRHHDVPAGTFSEGGYEWQAATKDALGLTGPFSPSAFFTADTPPAEHSITDPVNGATLTTATYPVVWSTPEQDAYQVQITDGEAVLFDTGVVESATTRQQALDFPENEVTRSIRVRIRYGGLWSEWAAVQVNVDYAAPAVPLLSVTGDDAAGTITVDIIHPEPTGSQPVVQSHDVWVREAGDTGDGMRLAADLYWNEAYTWWLPASGVDYQFRARAVVASGAGTYSPWVDYSTPQVASNHNGTLTIMDPLFRAHTIHITDNDDGTIAVSEPPTSWPALTSGTF